jgi:drug/metabolite transporter (DMT)-like permease
MASSGAAAGFGLLSAASWGGSDFAGGLGARRASSVLITASGQIVSLAGLLAICFGFHLAVPGARQMICGAVGGFEGAFALAMFYRALAMGPMGLTAALTGVLTAFVPVAFQFFHSGTPAPVTALGLLTGFLAIWLITHAPATGGSAAPPKALMLGAAAGVGFGLQLILFKTASEGGVIWAMTSGRIAGVAAILLTIAVVRPGRPWRGFWLAGIISGIFDTIGNMFYMLAAKFGRLDVAAVICSLYPASTILLAAVILHERPTRRQLTGMAVALAAVALLSI